MSCSHLWMSVVSQEGSPQAATGNRTTLGVKHPLRISRCAHCGGSVSISSGHIVCKGACLGVCLCQATAPCGWLVKVSRVEFRWWASLGVSSYPGCACGLSSPYSLEVWSRGIHTENQLVDGCSLNVGNLMTRLLTSGNVRG